METESVVLERDRLPGGIAVGTELDIRLRGRVRRIEAEHIDVTGFDGRRAIAVLEGRVFVEFTVLDVAAYTPEGHTPTVVTP